jgi:hypothetical protein
LSLQARITSENGRMGRSTGLAFASLQMESRLLESGETVQSRATARKYGLMVQHTRAPTLATGKTGKESSAGRTAAFMLGTLWMTSLMALVC